MKWSNVGDCDVESDADDNSDDDNDQEEDTESVAKEDEVVSAIVRRYVKMILWRLKRIYNQSAIKVLLVQRLLKSLETLRNLLLQ